MTVNPKSLANLKPAANRKDAVRVTLTLHPDTVALLKAQGNMSAAVDRLARLAMLGKIEHDGALNILPDSKVDFRSKF
ncbi:hypothetical protein QUA54_31480 [Microcoleus sp. MOSTC5]|uniref:hypothetical protein n=1 Tax=Microcoleus sp. MOSTC5 TaxID=3055378 RepID=UPI002FCF8AE9